MSEIRIVSANEEESQFISDSLRDYNTRFVALDPDVKTVSNRKAVDESGKVIAGILCHRYMNTILYVDILWVDDDHRGMGLGSRLLCELEEDAKEKGITLIHLDTFDFQARGFYEKHGYELFGTLEDCPQGHRHYYLKKSL